MPRCLFNSSRQKDLPGDGAPRGSGMRSIEARNRLAEFLDATLIKPLWLDDQDARVEKALDTMSLSERVYLEIEMQQRAKVFHSFNYDSLPY